MSMLRLMTAALAGAAVGAAAALAFAPEKGEVTRQKVKDRIRTAKDDLEELLEQGKKIVDKAEDTIKSESSSLESTKKTTAQTQSGTTGSGSTLGTQGTTGSSTYGGSKKSEGKNI